jgi:hypothetical protein
VVDGVHATGKGTGHALGADATGQAAGGFLLGGGVVVAALDLGEVVDARGDGELRRGDARLAVNLTAGHPPGDFLG